MSEVSEQSNIECHPIMPTFDIDIYIEANVIKIEAPSLMVTMFASVGAWGRSSAKPRSRR